MENKNQTNHIKKVKPANSNTPSNDKSTKVSQKASKIVGLGCIPSGLPPDLLK